MDQSNSGGRDTILPTFARTQVRFVLALVGIYFVGQGIYMAVAPGSFFEYVGPFGPQNDHYIRDNASFSVALGLSHLVDIGEADPDYYGPVEFALLFVGAVVLTATLVLATRESDAQS